MKLLQNKAYNLKDGRIFTCTYNDQPWTTNTYLAEAGEIDVRTYTNTLDKRNGQRPKLDTVIPNSNLDQVTGAKDQEEFTVIKAVKTTGYFDKNIYAYIAAKYPTNKYTYMIDQDGLKLVIRQGSEPVAIAMGLKK